MKAEHVVGVDYGVRRVAWASLAGPRMVVGELVLPYKVRDEVTCDLCNIAKLVAYFAENVVSTMDDKTVLAVERPIGGSSGNFRDTARMGMVAGALIGAAISTTSDHVLLSPGSWKNAALGYGNAVKSEIKRWAHDAYPDVPIPSQDVADAMAIAVAARQLIREEHCESPDQV